VVLAFYDLSPARGEQLMTLAQWSEAYAKIRAEAVRCAATFDTERLKLVQGYLLALPSFHYEGKKG